MTGEILMQNKRGGKGSPQWTPVLQDSASPLQLTRDGGARHHRAHAASPGCTISAPSQHGSRATLLYALEISTLRRAFWCRYWAQYLAVRTAACSPFSPGENPSCTAGSASRAASPHRACRSNHLTDHQWPHPILLRSGTPRPPQNQRARLTGSSPAMARCASFASISAVSSNIFRCFRWFACRRWSARRPEGPGASPRGISLRIRCIAFASTSTSASRRHSMSSRVWGKSRCIGP